MTIRTLRPLVAAAAIAAIVAPGLAAAQSSPWMIGVRALGIYPDASSSISGLDVKEQWTGELDFTYFFTKNIAAELILATARHEVKVKDTALGDVDLGHVWLLPPILSLQYHFFPDGKVSPYLGAGVNYTVFYGVDKPNSALIDDVDYDNRFGWALQAGMDWQVFERWSVNFDVKKLWLPAAVSVNDGAVKSRNADIDPWIIGVGIGYSFSL